MLHSPIFAEEKASDATRAQLLINSHIAKIDAALVALRMGKGRLIPSIYDMHNDKLNRLRLALVRDLDSVLAAPGSAFVFVRRWNHNAFGPNVDSACEAVDRAISRAAETAAYRAMIAARRAGLAVVR